MSNPRLAPALSPAPLSPGVPAAPQPPRLGPPSTSRPRSLRPGSPSAPGPAHRLTAALLPPPLLSEAAAPELAGAGVVPSRGGRGGREHPEDGPPEQRPPGGCVCEGLGPPLSPVVTATVSPALVPSALGVTASVKERCRTAVVGAQQRFGFVNQFACWEV